eukprot:TRINITY_DN416_c0_g1_i1.p1 TRINITY_DN416_c0_g1~~TRINITY_DN416_c0_g1_i1.p1  ORF type:complete len:295 (-),score=119.21 TRINITY_DN416_c0_g1_i1:142-1026(-)
MQSRIEELRPMDSHSPETVLTINHDEDGQEDSTFMPEFFTEVGHIKNSLSIIRRNLKAIQDAYDRQSISSSSQSSECDELMEATNEATAQVRTSLKKMKEETDEFDASNPHKRVRVNMHIVLTKKFMALLSEYQQLQTTLRDRSKEKLIRQAAIVNPDATDEDIELMLNSGDDLFGDKLASESRHSEAKNALINMQEQRRDLVVLEANIQELRTLFAEMGSLVESATETFTNIEKDMQTTSVNAMSAAHQLAIARAHEQARRRKLATLITGIVTLLLLGIAIVGVLMYTKVIKT